MNLLLDTHILLWSLDRPKNLPPRLTEALRSPENDVWFSSISVWEVAIKEQIGQLRLPGDWLEAARAQDFKPISFEMKHARAVSRLPLHHRDPFDRALLAQAWAESFTFVSMDEKANLYGDVVNLLGS